MKKILISDKLPREVIDSFGVTGNVTIDLVSDLGADPAELLRRIPEYDGLIVRSQTKVTADVIRAASRLSVIGRAGVGVDNINLKEATKQGILVMNTPQGNIISAAEHTMAMILALLRNIPDAVYSMRENKWEKNRFVGVELFGKTVGIVGLGRIGTLVAERAKGFGARIIAYDPYVTPERGRELGIELLSLDALIGRADILSLHTGLSKETTHLLGRDEFSRMKPGVLLVNCSRGAVIDESALHEALASGKVAGAALDVFEVEPARNNPLVGLPHVITTPHIAGSTQEAEENSARVIVSQVIDFLESGVIRNAVNVVPFAIENFDTVRPYVDLAESLGALQARLSGTIPSSIEVRYYGEVSEVGTRFITNAILKGLLSPLGERVNIVNAPVLAEERGIRVSETLTKDSQDYRSLIELEVTVQGKTRVVSGTIFGKTQPIFVRIDDFRIEALPSSRMLIFKNRDKPGVVGKVGTILGTHGINIADIHLSRVSDEHTALGVVNVDSDISESVLNEFRAFPEITEIQFIELER